MTKIILIFAESIKAKIIISIINMTNNKINNIKLKLVLQT